MLSTQTSFCLRHGFDEEGAIQVNVAQKISSAMASAPPGEPFAFRVSARRSVSEGHPCCSKSEAEIAASRAFVSRPVPCLAVHIAAGCTRALNRLSPLCFGRA